MICLKRLSRPLCGIRLWLGSISDCKIRFVCSEMEAFPKAIKHIAVFYLLKKCRVDCKIWSIWLVIRSILRLKSFERARIELLKRLFDNLKGLNFWLHKKKVRFGAQITPQKPFWTWKENYREFQLWSKALKLGKWEGIYNSRMISGQTGKIWMIASCWLTKQHEYS